MKTLLSWFGLAATSLMALSEALPTNNTSLPVPGGVATTEWRIVPPGAKNITIARRALSYHLIHGAWETTTVVANSSYTRYAPQGAGPHVLEVAAEEV